MIQRRSAELGIKVKIGCHTFRATGITAYLEAGGTLENAQLMAAHESPRTIIALEGDQDWWSQIEDALRSKDLQHFVLVVTPAALESRVVRQEIRLARQGGKMVSPVKGPGLASLSTCAGWAISLTSIWSSTVRR